MAKRKTARSRKRKIGRSPVGNDPRARTAADVKTLVRRLTDLGDDQLAEIPIVPAGTRLNQGAVYLDLRATAPVPFVATGDTVAGEHNSYAPKAEVPYETWNRLIEMLAPAQLQSPQTGETQVNQPFTPERAAAEKAIEQARSGELGSDAKNDKKVDEALEASFPASDPPAWTMGREKDPGPSETQQDDLNQLSDEELKRKAAALDISSRDSMTREQLMLAIRGQLSRTEV